MTFAPGKSVADLRLTLFVRLLPCSATAAVTFESLVELNSEANASNYSTKAQVKIFLESSDATGRLPHLSVPLLEVV